MRPALAADAVMAVHFLFIAFALLGSLLVRIWTKDGRAAMAGTKAEVDLAEQHIPRPPVVLHGVFAISTVVLVFFAALGVGPGA